MMYRISYINSITHLADYCAIRLLRHCMQWHQTVAMSAFSGSLISERQVGQRVQLSFHTIMYPHDHDRQMAIFI